MGFDFAGLDRLYAESVFYSYRDVIDGYVADMLKDGDNYFIPTVDRLCELCPDLTKDLVSLYDTKFPEATEYGIPDWVKVNQASLLDGLVFGVNIEKDFEASLFTANPGFISPTEKSPFSLGKTVDLNTKVVANAVRVDLDYKNDKGDFTHKFVRLNVNTNLLLAGSGTPGGRYYLIPFWFIYSTIKFIRSLLLHGSTLLVRQDASGLVKERYISCDRGMLEKFSSDSLVPAYDASYYPLKAFLYAPVLGASSLSVGLERVDLFNLLGISIVSGEPDIDKGVSGTEIVIIERCMTEILKGYYGDDTAYLSIIDRLPHIQDFTTDDEVILTPYQILQYFHSLSNKDKKKVIEMIPGLAEVSSRKYSMMKNFTPYTGEITTEGVKDLVNNGILKVVIQKKGATLSSMVVTNNRDILSTLYGKDYFKVYESVGTRAKLFREVVLGSKSDEEVLRGLDYYGFTLYGYDNEEALRVIELKNLAYDDPEGFVSFFTGSSPRKSSSKSNTILVRSCFASLSEENGVEGYYKYIDVDRIKSISILS